MDIDALKEQFGDILISFQRGEIDLPEALTLVRDMEEIEAEEPELGEEGEGEEGDGEGEEGGEGEGGDEGVEAPPEVDPAALEAAAADLDAALAIVNR